MKRSGGVTAAAIVLFLGSALFLLFMGLAGLASVLPQPSNVNPSMQATNMVFGVGMYGVLAAWGIVTAIGILRLRNWARISILVMAGFSVVGTLFAAAIMVIVVPMMSRMPEMRSGIAGIVVGIMLVTLAFPFGVSIWWLVLFLRKSVRLQFAGAGVGSVPADVGFSSASTGVGVAASGAPGMNPAQQRAGVSSPGAAKIPTSILVIAIFLFVGAGFVGLTIPMAVQGHMPFLLMGVLVPSLAAWPIVMIMGALELIFGIALLRRQAWSLDGTIAFAVFGMLNCLLFLLSPSRAEYIRTIVANYPVPPGAPPDMFPNMMHMVLLVSMWLTVVVNLIALYFLFTRRKAYREACAGKA